MLSKHQILFDKKDTNINSMDHNLECCILLLGFTTFYSNGIGNLKIIKCYKNLLRISLIVSLIPKHVTTILRVFNGIIPACGGLFVFHNCWIDQ